MHKIFLVIVLTLAVIILVGGMNWTKSNKNPVPTTATVSVNVTPADMKLVIVSPQNGARLTNANPQVTGQTTPNAEVQVNDNYDLANAKGDFSVPVTLLEGENFIQIVAVDDDGNSVEKELTVNY